MVFAPPKDLDDIIPDLEQRHRDAMLDLILAWGSLDGALGILLSIVKGLPLEEGAKKIGKMPTSAKFARLYKIFGEASGGEAAAKLIKDHKKSYKRLSKPRNLIAHSRCVGILAQDHNYIIFAAFEKTGKNRMALYSVPIQEMQRATEWGQQMREMVLAITNAPPTMPSSAIAGTATEPILRQRAKPSGV